MIFSPHIDLFKIINISNLYKKYIYTLLIDIQIDRYIEKTAA